MADAKIINYGQQISAGSTAIPDNTNALTIESTDGRDYIVIDTTDGEETMKIGSGSGTSDVCKVSVGANPGTVSEVFRVRQSYTVDSLALIENTGAGDALHIASGTDSGSVKVLKINNGSGEIWSIAADGDLVHTGTTVIGGSKSDPIIYNYNSNTSGMSSAITATPDGAAGMIIDHRVGDSLYLMNTTSENIADGRETGIAFFGRTDEASDEYPMMGALRVKHEGTAADQKGYMAFYTNDGTDDRVPTERMRIRSDGKIGINVANNELYVLEVRGSSTHSDILAWTNSTGPLAGRLESYDNEAGAVRIYSANKAGTLANQTQHLINGRDGSNGSVEFNIQQHDCDFNYSSENQANMFFIDADTDRVGIATNAPTEALDINSDAIRIRTSQTPASGGTGTAGMICWDANYMYVCTATDTWKRVALTGAY